MVEERIEAALQRVLAARGIPNAAIEIGYPVDLAHGDYATNIALKYAKELGVAPRACAEELTAALGAIDGVDAIEIAGPGFINFHLSPEVFAETIQTARSNAWARDTQLSGETILLEYTSPNLFKPLHVGNLVGNIIGESLARLFAFAGASVVRINYPSDIGLTVAKGVWGLIKTSADPADIAALGEAYRMGNAAYEDGSAKDAIDEINRKIYAGDKELNALRERGVATSLAHLDAICKRLGTQFEYELFESETGPIGVALVAAHIGRVFEKSDGAVIFPGEHYGLHTRVFITSAGIPTYEAKDLGNFKLKTEKFPNWSRYFVVTGQEQREYFAVVIAAIRKLFPNAAEKTIEHIPTGFLTPTTGKMSSRLGNVITGESLLADLGERARERAAESRAENKDELAGAVAVAAIKYQVLRQGTGTDILFDRDRALSLEGDSGPYLQYAHARAHQIVERAAHENVFGTVDPARAPNDVARLLPRFSELASRAARQKEPHILTTYAIELAGAFNSWYAAEQILDGSTSAPHKVALVDAVRATLKQSLDLLGIPAPERM